MSRRFGQPRYEIVELAAILENKPASEALGCWGAT